MILDVCVCVCLTSLEQRALVDSGSMNDQNLPTRRRHEGAIGRYERGDPGLTARHRNKRTLRTEQRASDPERSKGRYGRSMLPGAETETLLSCWEPAKEASSV